MITRDYSRMKAIFYAEIKIYTFKANPNDRHRYYPAKNITEIVL